MNARRTIPNSNLERVGLEATRILKSLFANPQNSQVLNGGLDRLRELIDSMVMGTAEHGLARTRIKNAQRFVESGEYGAARYEIRLLKGGLKQQLETTTPPKRVELVDLRLEKIDVRAV